MGLIIYVDEELKGLVGDSEEEAKREKEDREKQEARILMKDELASLREEIDLEDRLLFRQLGKVKVVRFEGLNGYFIVA